MKKARFFVLFVFFIFVVYLFVRCALSSEEDMTTSNNSILPNMLYDDSQIKNYSYDITAEDVYIFAKACMELGKGYEGRSLMSSIGYGESIFKRLSSLEIDSFMNNVSISDIFGFEPQIGGKGPSGGWIFYDKGMYSDGWRYLEAAPSDLSGGRYVWGENGWIKTSTEIGTGYANTMKISSYRDGDVTAAKACLDYSVNGYDDWFLPSKDELNLMYENLYKKGIGSFVGDYAYWSSSKRFMFSAWKQYFNSGSFGDHFRSKKFHVRPIRAF